jgi:hypothetical protein
VAHDLLGDRAEQRPADPGPAVTPEHDQIERRIVVEYRERVRAGTPDPDHRRYQDRDLGSEIRRPVLEQVRRSSLDTVEEVGSEQLPEVHDDEPRSPRAAVPPDRSRAI